MYDGMCVHAYIRSYVRMYMIYLYAIIFIFYTCMPYAYPCMYMCMTELEIVQISVLPQCLVKSILVKFSIAIICTIGTVNFVGDVCT